MLIITVQKGYVANNIVKMKEYDLIIIGGGATAFAAAIGLIS